MKCSFYKWYSQSLGATLGIIACIFAYLNGYMFVYTNIENNFDYLGFDGVLSSYLLLPLCIVTLILGIVRSYSYDKSYFNFSFEDINKTLSIITIIIGFLGAKYYFIIPSIVIIIGFISINLSSDNNLECNSEDDTNEIETIAKKSVVSNQKQDCEFISSNSENQILEQEFIEDETLTYNEYDLKSDREAKLLMTRKDIVINLLSKDAELGFISDITGFTLDEIEIINNNVNSN